jgi:D-lactate dehydrogenase (cytochrome)
MNIGLKQDMFKELKKLLEDRVSEEELICKEHGTGFSYHHSMPPDFVVYPQSIPEIAAVVRLCDQHQIPIIPFGAGTSVEGHILAVQGGVCMDLKRMNKVLELNLQDMNCTIQSGVTRNQLDSLLEGSGFFFPVGPGVNATIGGMAATRASGTNAVKYGTMKDNVLSLTVVLPNGQIIRTASKAKKSSTGYDLTSLFIGSEGTLGIIAELTVKLRSYPEISKAAVCSFPTIEAAVNTAIKIIQQGIAIARVEFLDAFMMNAINRYSNMDYREEPTLFLEFNGSLKTVEEQILAVEKIALEFGAAGFIWEKDEASRRKMWTIRTDAAPAVASLMPGAKMMSTDVCVPISQLAKCIIETQLDLQNTRLVAGILGHVGDGNFHLAIPILPDDQATFEKAKQLNERLVRRALAMDGTSSGEHGIGIGKQHYMNLEHGNALGVMRSIKRAIDPKNIMNPGKLLPDPD